jgi:hypothetical protein
MPEEQPQPSDLLWSTDIDKIAEAFVNAGKAVETMSKDADNPHFKSKFASINAAYAVVKPALADQDCSVSHAVSTVAGSVAVSTRVTHTSGQWVRTPGLLMPVAQPDPQKVGSAITYGKRYDLVAMFALETADDDGNLASGKAEQETATAPDDLSLAVLNAMKAIPPGNDREAFKAWVVEQGGSYPVTMAVLRGEPGWCQNIADHLGVTA